MNDLLPLTENLWSTRDQANSTARKIGNRRKAIRANWHSPVSMENGWVNYDGTNEQFAYTKDNDGYVHFKGMIKSGGNQANVFTLPEELRPATTRMVYVAASGGAAALEVTPAGAVNPTNGSGASVTTWVSLSGAMYHPANYLADAHLFGMGSAKYGDLTTSPAPFTRQHLGGMIVAGGGHRHWSDPTLDEITINISHEHGSVYRHLLPLWGRTGATSALTRMDVQKQNIHWESGQTGTNSLHWSGISWPSYRLHSARTAMTLGAGVTQYPLSGGGNWPPQLSVYKDDMNFCWVGGIVNLTTVTAGTQIATMPVGHLPSRPAHLPAIGNGVATSVRVRPNGAVELVENVAVGWYAIAHGYWTDN